MDSTRWHNLLSELSRTVLASSYAPVDTLDGDHTPGDWLGFAPANAAEIAAAENRLGVRFPPSYRAFLAVSNGWRTTGPFIDRLWSSTEVDWFSVRNQDWIDIWTEDPMPVSDEEYATYGDRQDAGAIRTEYLPTMLEVSDVGDAAVILLNPQVVTPEGEWEAWFFASWIPGAYRFRSFWELMQDQLEGAHRALREERGEPEPSVHPSLGIAADDVDGLLAALSRPDWNDRLHAIEALGNLREPRAVEPLTTIFADPHMDLMLRERAAVALGRTRDPQALNALIAGFGSPLAPDTLKVGTVFGNPATIPCDPDDVAAVSDLSIADFLKNMPEALRGVVPPELLHQIVTDLTPDRVAHGFADHLSHAIRQGILAYGPAALPALQAALDSPDPELRRQVQATIAAMR